MTRAWWTRNIFIVALLAAAWMVMNESVHLLVLITAVPIAVIALILTNRTLHIDYAQAFSLSPLSALRYIGVLLREIAIGAVGMVKVIVTGQSHTQYFEFHSSLTDETLLFLLSNTIILTPGSVAVGRAGSTITVMAVGDLEAAYASCRKLERSVAALAGGA
ncbi:MAG: Na+/H+ antiporter subunit E [Cellulomonadaceae bacterium]|jgi:multicomponent Na+:H+ antiporter subunit E|nr:Na+/H+ antiporter subunit E [Cellulomonadaceae bacterium]